MQLMTLYLPVLSSCNHLLSVTNTSYPYFLCVIPLSSLPFLKHRASSIREIKARSYDAATADIKVASLLACARLKAGPITVTVSSQRPFY